MRQWTYTTPPDGIDLEAPLMPARDSGDMTRYGIDPAAQHEILCVWLRGMGYAVNSKLEMSRTPAAYDTNQIRARAKSIRTGTDSGRFLAASIPSGVSAGFDGAISFGAVPADVAVGDPVRRADVSDMYSWMSPSPPVRYGVDLSPSDYSYAVTAFDRAYKGTTGTGEGYEPIPIPATPSSGIYLYDSVKTLPETAWHYMDGWTRITAKSETSLTVRLPDSKRAWYSSIALFAKIHAEFTRPFPPGGSGSHEEAFAYVPLGASVVQSGADLLCTAQNSVKASVSSVLGFIGWAEGDNGYCRLSLSDVAVACEFAADYRAPFA